MKDSVKQLKTFAPTDKELHRIAVVLDQLQKENECALYASVKHRGHYYHEGCTTIDAFNDEKETTKDTEDTLTECLRDFMRWIYRRLEAEYEFQSGTEQIDESIRANEYEFSQDGSRA